MSRSNSARLAFALLALFASLAMLNPTAVSVGAKSERPVAPNIRITPPAPVFDQKERVTELMQ
ncbi:MAG TPA: hypothetical protein VFY60_05350, partial [Pyrinomonadaceae bacterium]|nr:hypothetical protein [Pyrinomonadaceae bacterium]